MLRVLKYLLITIVACSFAPTGAFAHAFLDRAVPGVGTTVALSPSELELSFTQNIVAAFSGVHIAAEGGKSIASGKPSIAGNVMRVRLAHPLRPGTYVVSWHVVSVDTHHTSGTYKFKVSP
jgi:copper resistance protein C